MGDPRYRAGVAQGLKGDSSVPRTHSLWDDPWPLELPGLGPRSVRAFELCLDCFDEPGKVHRSWAHFGDRAVCWHHASRRAAAAKRRRGAAA